MADDKECTFKPKTNLAKKKTHSRYLNKGNDETQVPKKKPATAKIDDEENCKFKPKINPISDALMSKRSAREEMTGEK